MATRLCRHMLKNNHARFILMVQQTLRLEVGKNILLACSRLFRGVVTCQKKPWCALVMEDEVEQFS